MNVEWKPIPGFPRYLISENGEVKGPRRLLTSILRPSGYMQVTLYADGRKYTRNVHTLVASAFLGERPEGHHVCHNNGDKADNRLVNLRYDTPVENWNDYRVHGGGRHNMMKTHCPRGHELSADNLMPSQLAYGWRSCLTCNQNYYHRRRQVA